MTLILILIAFGAGIAVGRYAGKNGWAALGGAVVAAAAAGWNYVQGWF